MHVSDISFCDKTAYNIKDDATMKQLMSVLKEQLSLDVLQNRDSYDKYGPHCIESLSSHAHLACLKSCGNAYLFFLTRLKFTNCCLIIDRKLSRGHFYPRILVTHFSFSDALFDNTVLEGEMVCTNTGQWVFLLGDIPVYKNQILSDTNLLKRIGLMHGLLDQEYHPDSSDVCHFQVKRYAAYPDLKELVCGVCNALPYSCTALVLRPLFRQFRDIYFELPHVNRHARGAERSRMLPNGSGSGSGSSSRGGGGGGSHSSLQQQQVGGAPLHQPATGGASDQVFVMCATATPDVYELQRLP
eukprot:jgi/Chrzof1/11491/UNPLg00423.t1